MVNGEPVAYGDTVLPPRGAALRAGRLGSGGRVKAKKPQLIVASRKKIDGMIRVNVIWWPPIEKTGFDEAKAKKMIARLTDPPRPLSAKLHDAERYWREPGKRLPRHYKPRANQWANWRMSQGYLGGRWQVSQLRKPNRKAR